MEFRIIKDFPNYEINKNCEIRSIKTGRIIKQYITQSYLRVNLIKTKGVKGSAAVHRLMAIAFIPNPDNLPIIDHINQNKTDNDVNNLRWVSYKENSNNVDPIKRKHKTRITSKFSIFLCDETNKWIIKIKNKNSKNKIICDMNFEEVMLYINDNNIGK